MEYMKTACDKGRNLPQNSRFQFNFPEHCNDFTSYNKHSSKQQTSQFDSQSVANQGPEVASPVLSNERFLGRITEVPREQTLFDPYQVFEVEQTPCLILDVTVLCGRNITKGWQDYVDTPDPYIHICIRTAPEGRQKTTVKDNEVNPVWNESFTFLLDETLENIMEIRLMESNYMYDEEIGVQAFNIAELKRDVKEKKTFVFNNVSEIDIEMTLTFDKEPTLRYSLCLCDQEKEFLARRKQKVMEGMSSILPADKAPKNIDEVPTIAVIGSGGGFRAMVGMSGVVKALHDAGILQCSTYICGLSGSSWYISTLYSHPNWPHMAPGEMQEELKNNIDSSFLWLLNPQGVYRYMDLILKKRQNGQPISFTDFFGYLVGETLLRGNRINSRLTDQQAKISDGSVPMPLLTCVHVKRNRSERSFQEWVEFSPYEIGMAKYGIYMPTELFGCKFFMGKLCKRYPEPPLHFLQGIWGSAFCILFKRLFEDNRRVDPVEMIRQEMAKQLEENQYDESSDSSDDGEFNDAEDILSSHDQLSKEIPLEHPVTNNNSNAFRSDPERVKTKPQPPGNALPNIPKRRFSTRRTKQRSYWSNFVKGVLENKTFEMLNSRAGRAGLIHNFMRGLSLHQSYPYSPFTPAKKNFDELDSNDSSDGKEDDFDGIFEMHPTSTKHLYMVDAGLTFNSPFPVVLRQQREVDIILSFDFSARPSDSTPPFKELLIAAQWAKKQRVLFPPIDTTVFDREGMKELYIFRDPNNARCPIVFHFCLVNVEFRQFSKPGIPRRTKEDKSFADFDIFDDPTTPYSTFNFKYSHLAFEKLSKLMEFNTLLNIEEIKNIIVEVIERKRATPSSCCCKLEDVPKLRRVSHKNKERLSRFLTRLRSGRFSWTDAKRDIDKSIEKETINEEIVGNSVDAPANEETPSTSVDESSKNYVCKLKRQTAISRKDALSRSITGSLSEMTVSDRNPEIKSEPSANVRDIPGRRKPIQPDTSVEDKRCFSIGDDEQFFSALE